MVFCRKPPWPIHPSNARSSMNHTGIGDKYFCLIGGWSTLAIGLTVSRWWFINFQSTHDECFFCEILVPQQLAGCVSSSNYDGLIVAASSVVSLHYRPTWARNFEHPCHLSVWTGACWLDQCVCLGKALLYRGPWIGPATGDSFGL